MNALEKTLFSFLCDARASKIDIFLNSDLIQLLSFMNLVIKIPVSLVKEELSTWLNPSESR